MNKRPDVVLTVGPASQAEELLRRVCDVATRIRLNTGHLDRAALAGWLTRLTAVFAQTGRAVPVVLDLQGAKTRIGGYPSVAAVPPEVTLRHAESSVDPAVIPVPHPVVLAASRVGDLLHLNDGRVVVRVVGVAAGGEELRALTVVSGPLSGRKGINCPGRVWPLAELCAGDRAAIEVALAFPLVEFAVSFVADGSEAELLRPLVGTRRLIAKIEREAALAQVPALAARFDELWLCRGDLGAEIDLRLLGRRQAEFTALLPTLGKPALLAGEVLGSMVTSPQPSRSEIVHLYDVLQAGFAGFVLSDETAQGGHVPAVLEFLARHLG